MTFPADYTVLDLETTGLRADLDEIIEIAAVKVRGNTAVDAFSTLVRPKRKIPYFITDLTGISNAMAARAPSIEQVMPRFLDFLEDDVILGHNVSFDIRFLRFNALRCEGVDLCNPSIDTMRISRRLFPEERHHRLSDLEQRFSLHNDRAHRAMSDALLTKAAYDRLRELAE